MGWKKSAPYGASDLAKIRAGFLHKAERLLHGVQIAKNLENSDKWYQRCLAASVTKAESIKKSPSGRSVHHHHPLPLLEDCVHSSIVFVGAVFDLI